MQSLNGKTTGDSLTASEWNQVPSELQNIIVGTGQTLSAADLNQLGKGVAGYVATSDVYISSGPADAYVLTPISGFQGPTSYFDGMRVRFVPNVANTGGSVTVNVNGLGVRTVVREDGLGNSSNTEYQVGVMVELRFDSSANNFKLRRIRNAGTATNEYGLTRRATQTDVNGGTESFDYVTPLTLNDKTALESRRGVAEIATQTETNTGTDDTRIVTPLKLQTRLGLLGSDDITNDSTVTGSTVSDALETLDSAIPSASLIVGDITTSGTSIPTSTPVTVLSVTTPSGYTGPYHYTAYINFDNLDANDIQIQLVNIGAGISNSTITSFYRGSGGVQDLYYRGGDVASLVNTTQLVSVFSADITDSSNVIVKVEGRLAAVGDGTTILLQVRNNTAASTVTARSTSTLQLVPV